jgi:precorrin-6x reductase
VRVDSYEGLSALLRSPPRPGRREEAQRLEGRQKWRTWARIGELTEVKILLADLINRVLKTEGAEDIETRRAAVANQLINTRLRAIEVERKVKETDELLARLEELEAAQGARNGARTWR